ncbi:very short patch repair endonuclease [Lentzea albidocapillata]|uniref:very short patch repair endonuclease n=1 Tax=Lentzea albidocapillata TaxID=40571 RepID=UPI000A004C31|nr:very short patch repair endonuclease [Lentzea albidocapillata]
MLSFDEVGGPVSDRWIATAEGQHLRGRPTRNTKPELALRCAVHALGLRYRIHQQVAPRCTPDFILPRHRLAVFVDGCFWHGCPAHTPARFRGPNADQWAKKINTNRERDLRNNQSAADAGWHVVRVWECEIRRDAVGAAQRIWAETSRGAAD